jgi:UDP-3-O-[3-hydroxymyristoyl] N-acetylglucosamine deacetylase
MLASYLHIILSDMFYQTTLKEKISFTGIGLHLGKKVNVTIKPAPVDTGVIFIRTDVTPNVEIKAELSNVVDTKFATTLGKDGIIVSTVEHLLAAFSGMGVDNAIVEVNSSEVPIMDGSSAPFVYLLKSSGIVRQNKPKKFLVVKKPVKIAEDGKEIKLVPSKEFKISYTIEFDHPLITKQSLSLIHSYKSFDKEISPARTFGFLRDVEILKKNGYAKGGSLDNAIVLDDFRVLNYEGLRFNDEFVRHKILDLIGDLAILGVPIIGHVVAYKAGHSANIKFINKILSECNKHWEYVTFYDEREFIRDDSLLPAFQIS